jgi:GGDEF domain-containing protein
MKQGPQLEDLSSRLCEAIQNSVRHSDAFCRYGKGQFLVLLINTTAEDCSIVQRRINDHFIIGRQRTGIRYHVNIVVSKY